jgi:hypothetical protein
MKMSQIQNEVSFNKALKAINKSGEALAEYIHAAGLFALLQVNQHNNNGFAVRLLEAMGKKHDAKRVEKWLCHFGKLGMKGGLLVYRARRDITPETLDKFQAEAAQTPYWELTEQEHHAFKFNCLGMLESILSRSDTAKAKAAAGEEVEIVGPDLVAEVTAIINRHKAAAAAQVQATVAGKAAAA